jgi:hypothetical protein
MGRTTQRISWAFPLAYPDRSMPGGPPGNRTLWGEGKPLLASCCWPEVGRCAIEYRCVSDLLPGRDGQYRAPCGGGPGLCWLLRASDLPVLSGAGGPERRDHPHDLRFAVSLDALVQRFPAPSSAGAPDFQATIFLAAECSFAARREIQRSVRTPISLRDVTVLCDLLGKVSDLLTADSVTDALGRPVSGPELADSGYRLLDIAHEYCILAEHFYSDEVQTARARRPSDAAEAEIAAVACKAAALKFGVMKYLKKVGEVLREKATPLS